MVFKMSVYAVVERNNDLTIITKYFDNNSTIVPIVPIKKEQGIVCLGTDRPIFP